MSNSVSSQLLLESLANCVRERSSRESLDQLCQILDDGLTSVDDPHVELFEALANYVYQLRDGAIQTSDDTASLFREALVLLGEDPSSLQRASSADRTAGLLERIDLAASGGFDALEAGEIPDAERLIDAKSESLRIQSTLHRLHSSLETIERHTQSSPLSPSFTSVLSRHRQLLDALAPSPSPSQSVSLTSLDEMLSLEVGESETDITIDAEGSVHPSYLPTLSSIVTQLTNTFPSIRVMKIFREQDTLDIQLTFDANDSISSSLRTSAINHGFLNSDAPLRNGDEIQYLLVPDSSQPDEQLIQSSSLFDHLQSLCARVVAESSAETTEMSITLPANFRLEQVVVFKQDGALYAVWTDIVADIEYATFNEDISFRSFIENDQGSFRVVNSNQMRGEHEACLFINDGGFRVALFVDQIETPGQLAVLDSLSPETHLGGGVRLLDRRFVVLLSAVELNDGSPPSLNSQVGTTRRLLVLGSAPLAKGLSRNTYHISHAAGELEATATFQEQRPYAILVEQNELPAYRRLLSTAKRLDVPVVVQISPNRDDVSDISNTEFRSVRTLTELEAQLNSVSGNQIKLQPTKLGT